MHGFKPHHNDRPRYAGGGVIDSIKEKVRTKLGFTPQPDREQANDPDPAQRVGGDQAASPQATRRMPTRSPTNTGPADRRMQIEEERMGFKAGGAIHPEDDDRNLMDPVRPGAVEMVNGPGTGTSDDVPAEMERGTHILPAKTTEEVLLSNGEAAVSPQVVQAVGQAALDALRGATKEGGGMGFKPGLQQDAPVGTMANPIEAAPRGFNAREIDDPVNTIGPGGPRQKRPRDRTEPMGFAVGGTVGEDDPNAAASRMYLLGAQQAAATREAAAAEAQQQEVAAAAASQRAPAPLNREQAIAAIPAAAPAAPQGGQRVDSTEAGRNLNNAAMGFSPLGGALARGVSAAGRLAANALPASTGARAAIAGGAAAGAAMTGDTNQVAGQPSPAAAPANTDPTAQPSPAQTAASPGAVAPLRQEGPGQPRPDVNAMPAGTPAGPALADVNVLPAFRSTPTENFLPAGFQPQQYRQAPGTDWQSRQDLRNAETGASSIVNSPARAQAQAQAAALRGERAQGARDQSALDIAGVRAASDQSVAATRAAVDTAGQQQRNQVDMARVGNETAETQRRTTATDLSNAQASQLAAAQRSVLDAPTPEARSAAVENLRALQGNYERQSRVVVVPGAKNPDGSQDAATVVDAATGQPIGGAGAAKRPAAAQQERPVGSTSTLPDGRTATWDGSKWVPNGTAR